MLTKFKNKIKKYARKLRSKLFPITSEYTYVAALENSLKAIVFTCQYGYVYPFNPATRRVVPEDKLLICSNTVDYAKVIASNFKELRAIISNSPNRQFRRTELRLLKQIDNLSRSVTKYPDMWYHDAQSLDEAIQKLLFFNALLWQAGHWHVGLGRLDKVLYPYYKVDVEQGIISREEASDMIYRMLQVLDNDMVAKSGAIEGDTGQYILLGGVDENGKAIANDLTHIFLEIFQIYNHPDPKLILRVNENTDDQVWAEAIDSILKGHGSPLLMNEKPIMENMVLFGYDQEDIYNIGTSACWEPLVIGKSFDQNNSLPSIVVLQSLNKLFEKSVAPKDFDSLLLTYKDELSQQIRDNVYNIAFDVSPLYSLFIDDCMVKGLDYTKGGAKYAYHGLEIVSLPNTINALLNIKHLIYEKHLLTWAQCQKALKVNFEGYEHVLQLLKEGDVKYGNAIPEVVALTNDIMTYIGDYVSKLTINGNPVKVGFSSPNYIEQSGNVGASMDGRRNGEPFAVHISPISSHVDIVQIIDFASQLNYTGNRINGNVVDFIVPTSYAKNKDKLKDILKYAISKGIFEIQLNTLDSKTLIDARKNPDKYKHLIVRVWGFSAYFNDLPDEYKDNLIERAKLYEAA